MDKNYFPLNKTQLETLAEQYGTPFYIYDEEEICKNFLRFVKAFNDFPNFKEYFSVKACPNPYILKILKKEGSGASCSSLAEIILAENAGFTGEDIFFTTKETTAKEIIYGNLKGCLFNLDDISHIDFIAKTLGGLPDFLSFCYNLDSFQFQEKSKATKAGLPKEQILQTYKISKERGVKRLALHVNLNANQITIDYFVQLVEHLFLLAVEIKEKVGIKIETINLGNGIGISFAPDYKNIDYEALAKKIKALYDKILVTNGLDSTTIAFECSHIITGPYGWLVTRVMHKKSGEREYIGLDATLASLKDVNLENYHNITVTGKEKQEKNHLYDVSGSLFEDKDSLQKELPQVDIGDLLVIHNVGAYCSAKELNYNGNLRPGELLLRQNGTVIPIRRRETLDDYFSTIDFVKLKTFSV